eukprot:1580258-Amphidinium_carterae.1
MLYFPEFGSFVACKGCLSCPSRRTCTPNNSLWKRSAKVANKTEKKWPLLGSPVTRTFVAQESKQCFGGAIEQFQRCKEGFSRTRIAVERWFPPWGVTALEAMTGDHSRDAQLMTICALLSSVLVLNTKGALNEGLFNALALTCRFAEHIESKGNEVSFQYNKLYMQTRHS